jgi:hypothetical protein
MQLAKHLPSRASLALHIASAKHTSALLLVAILAACDRPEKVDQAVETPQQRTLPKPAEVDTESAWQRIEAIDKMTAKRQNKVTRLAQSEHHLYRFLVECDSDGLGIKIQTFELDGRGVAIPWKVEMDPILETLAAVRRPIRVRFESHLHTLRLSRTEVENIGGIELNPRSADYETFVGESQSKSHPEKLQKTFGYIEKLLRSEVLNIADVFPGEVIELDPPSGKNQISGFIESCRKILSPLPARIPASQADGQGEGTR